MTRLELVNLVADLLTALIAVGGIGGGLYFFAKSLHRGSISWQLLLVIMVLSFFSVLMNFLFTHFTKAG